MRDDGRREDELNLAIRAAWLHYAGGMTQAEVARRLGIPGVKAHRLITRANLEGLVRVSIEGDIVECVELEHRLAERYGLAHAEVAPDLADEAMPLRALGIAGAAFLSREIDRGAARLIGVGHGRTLAACVDRLPRRPARTDLRFVSLLGGLTRNLSANPHDTMHRLAEKTGAEAYVMPVPFFANTLEDRAVMLAQRGVADVFALAARTDLKLVGIGTVEAEASLVLTGMISPAEIAEVKATGAAGEMLGHFFDAGGAPVATAMSARTVSLPLDRLEATRIVAVAGGRIKTAAIRAVLHSRRLTGLVTDERTARALLGDH